MCKGPLVSVIVPVYECEKFIDKCIMSVLNQRFKNFELILVNDGSSDRSLNICYNYSLYDSRIVVLTHLNRGVSFTRNKGLSIAKGDWIYFIDSDDFLEEDAFDFLLDSEFSDFDILYFGMNKVNSEGLIVSKFINETNAIYKGGIDFYNNNTVKLFNIVMCFYRSSLLKKYNILFKEGVSYGEDLAFSMSVFSLANNIKVFDRIIYNYLVENNVSAMNRKVTNESIIDHLILSKYLAEFASKLNVRKSQLFIEDVACVYLLKSFFSRILLLKNPEWKLLNNEYKFYYKEILRLINIRLIFFRLAYIDIRIYCYLMMVKVKFL